MDGRGYDSKEKQDSVLFGQLVRIFQAQYAERISFGGPVRGRSGITKIQSEFPARDEKRGGCFILHPDADDGRVETEQPLVTRDIQYAVAHLQIHFLPDEMVVFDTDRQKVPDDTFSGE